MSDGLEPARQSDRRRPRPAARSAGAAAVGAAPGRRWAGWLFAAPALAVYAVFVLRPLVLTVQYSLYDWNGIGAVDLGRSGQLPPAVHRPRPVRHDRARLRADRLLQLHPGRCSGLVVAAADPADRREPAGAASPARCCSCRRSSRWSRPASCGAGCSRPTGLVNQLLSPVGLGGVTRAWLGDFDTALPAVGVIGAWVLLGLCTLLLLAGHEQDRPRAVRGGPARRRRAGARVPLHHPAQPAPGDRRLRDGDRDRRAGQLRHHLHLHPGRARATRPWCPAWRSTTSPSPSARSAWPRRSPSC